ncbi:MAG: hypothetical protein IJ356_12065 [Erysipelotrichaceae bacterium]|nr:hypothetical protein [Erysipelotrichaceae bacterium]MBQ7890484.1 hypothetical protein [Erysipelotrichaceae bacterium]
MATNKTKEIDIKEIISDAVEKIMKDEKLQKQFMDEPVKALEKLLNVDLPDELIEKVIDGIKAKITVDKLADAADLLKKLF